MLVFQDRVVYSNQVPEGLTTRLGYLSGRNVRPIGVQTSIYKGLYIYAQSAAVRIFRRKT